MNGSVRPINLQAIARETLLRFGFLIDPPPAAQAELAKMTELDFSRLPVQDLSSLLWSSIDNDDSRDLDQIEYLKTEPNGSRLYVGIADVSALITQNSALDQAAWHNTTSLYTGLRTFPLFPEKLSTNLTSLVEGEKRLSVVIEMLISAEGKTLESTVYPAIVQNQAQLTYNAVASWLDHEPGDNSPVTLRMMGKIQSNAALQDQLRRQHAVAEALRQRRVEAGALTFETIELRPTLLPDGRWELKGGVPNSATHLIEDFMIAANQATVAFLLSKNFPTLRRVVRTPKNWPRIVELAAQHDAALPATPEAKPLEDFLSRERQKDPDHFPDLSLSIIKLLGRGEYVVAAPGGQAAGHFALAVEGYSHSTAPNRRYPDVITQRLLKAANAGEKTPYSTEELALLAQHCTQKEDDANKAERSVHKSLAAAAMAHQIGQTFEGFITGASDKGVWVRLLKPPVEGKVEGVTKGLAVGDRVIVKLIATDPWRGYIDFDVISRR
jgi:VacB/RNase II family 3'-5' exoribonuclease